MSELSSQVTLKLVFTNDRGEPAVSYKTNEPVEFEK